MPQTIVVGDTEYEFPDDMTDDQIRSALALETGAQAKPPPFWPSPQLSDIPEATRNVPRGLVQAGEEIMGGVPGALSLLDPRKAHQFVPMMSQAIGATGERFAERYGTPEHAYHSLIKDPVGTGLDASTVVSPLSPKAGAVLNPAAQIPAASTRLARKGVAHIARDPAKTYAGAMQPSKALALENYNRIIAEGLKYGARPTPGSLRKINQRASRLEADIDASLAARPDVRIDISELTAHLPELRERFGTLRVRGKKDLDRVDNIVNRFLLDQKKTGKTSFSLQEMNTFKRKAYMDASQLYTGAKKGKRKHTLDAEVHANLARAAKEAIERHVPEIKAMNSEWGTMIDLKDLVESSIKRQPTKLINWTSLGEVGTGASVGGLTGFMMGGPPGATIGSALGTLAGVGAAVGGRPTMAASRAIRRQRLRDKNVINALLDPAQGLSAAELAFVLSGRGQPEDL